MRARSPAIGAWKIVARPSRSSATRPRVSSRSTTTARARCGSARITRSSSAPKPGSEPAVTAGETVTFSSMKPGAPPAKTSLNSVTA